jgi:hypothetical protein
MSRPYLHRVGSDFEDGYAAYGAVIPEFVQQAEMIKWDLPKKTRGDRWTPIL